MPLPQARNSTAQAKNWLVQEKHFPAPANASATLAKNILALERVVPMPEKRATVRAKHGAVQTGIGRQKPS